MTLHRVVGPSAAATVDPARGGKLTSLTGPDGREWLSQATDPLAPASVGANFAEGDPSGWDECAPSIDACEVDGHPIPDHGDLWAAAWSVTSSKPDLLDMTAIGTSLDYLIRRRIAATPAGFRLEYSARARARDVPFLWAAHPLFASPPGTVVELSPAAPPVIDVLDPGAPRLPWSAELSTLDTLPSPGCRKVYVDPDVAVTAATIRHADGSALTMTWQNCPYLGLWFDNGTYSREPVVALEPSLAFRDSLALAVELDSAPTLTTGRDLAWAIEIAFSPTT